MRLVVIAQKIIQRGQFQGRIEDCSMVFYRAHRPRAASIAEVLISLALLIPVVVLVAGLFPYSFSVDKKAWNERTAQSLARSALEQARSKKFDSLKSFDERASKDGTSFRVDVTVTDVPLAPAGTKPPEVREKIVSCKVSWPRRNGEDSLKMETRVAKLFQAGD